MDINYVVLAHNDPYQLKRLVLSLRDSATYFYIHIDKKSDIDPFTAAFKYIENVYLLPFESRETCAWADVSLVKATLNALKAASKNSKSGYITILSGQDYPIKSKTYIRNFFEENYGTEFIELYAPAAIWNTADLRNRFQLYKKNRSAGRADYVLYPSIYDKAFYQRGYIKMFIGFARSGDFSFLKKIIRKRKAPAYINTFGGSAWWSLTVDTVNKILKFADTHPGLFTYYEDSLFPDELFFQSMIMSIDAVNKALIRPNLTYVNWTKPNRPRPVIFNEDDFDELAAQENYLYARKFVRAVDDKVIDLIDTQLLNE